jgi:hypothetical protein
MQKLYVINSENILLCKVNMTKVDCFYVPLRWCWSILLACVRIRKDTANGAFLGAESEKNEKKLGCLVKL